MKKFVIATVAVLMTSPVVAQVQGGFTGPSAVKVHTVAEAAAMHDDARVELVGNIVESLGDEKYTFKDATGTIVVDIDNEDWRGLEVAPEDTVTISGEVDKELMKDAKIDVSTITK